MDYQRIRCFLRAAETENFSEAARQLYITPQAFGKQINLLEQELGFPLFERSTRQIKLTSGGKECYDSLKTPFQILEKEYEKIIEFGNQKNRLIRIGVFNALSRKKVVSPIVTGILSHFPDRDIRINMYDMGQMQQEINAGKMDLGIMNTHDREAGWEACQQIVLQEISCKVVVSESHKWAGKEAITEEDMREEVFTRMNPSQFTKEDYFGIIPCKKQIVAENYETMCMNVDQGCFTIMPYEMDSLSEQGYKIFELPRNPFMFRLVLMYNKNVADDFVQELCQFVRDKFETIGL